jgi:2-oxoglutarate dehydrogenase E2 component (dihydrolipoamide succinyltransferase)
MATVSIKVPGVGESITEGILARWLKADGAPVKAGEPLFELETDKASNVVPAPSSGVLRVKIAEGTTVAIGAEIGLIDSSASAAAQAQVDGSSAGAASAASASPTAPRADSAVAASVNGGEAKEIHLSPAVRRIVAEERLDPAAIAATGPGGRLTKGDVLEHVSASSAAIASPPRESAVASAQPAATIKPSATAVPRETRKRMSGIRQKIAQRLVEAQRTAAILTTFNEADMSAIMDLRNKYKEAFKNKHSIGLGFMSFFVKAAVEALREFPAVNARVEGSDIVYHNVYDVGVAVSTERGLMVPVIRDADKLSFAGIEKAIAAYAVKAREGTISVADLQGGTFTITNGGVFGSLLSTPILNPPQSGILGMHAIQNRPVARGDQVVVRPMMYLALSYDHRIVDGREAVSFLVKIKEKVESPERLMLDV